MPSRSDLAAIRISDPFFDDLAEVAAQLPRPNPSILRYSVQTRDTSSFDRQRGGNSAREKILLPSSRSLAKRLSTKDPCRRAERPGFYNRPLSGLEKGRRGGGEFPLKRRG